MSEPNEKPHGPHGPHGKDCLCNPAIEIITVFKNHGLSPISSLEVMELVTETMFKAATGLNIESPEASAKFGAAANNINNTQEIPDTPEELFAKTGNLSTGTTLQRGGSAGVGISFCPPSMNLACRNDDCGERALGGVVGKDSRTNKPLTIAKCPVHLMVDILQYAKLVVETVYNEEFKI